MSFYGSKGESGRGLQAQGVSRYRDKGEWIRAGRGMQGEALRGYAPDMVEFLRTFREVIAFFSLFGHHPAGEPAKWADSHLRRP